jgi:hypothetical protein
MSRTKVGSRCGSSRFREVFGVSRRQIYIDPEHAANGIMAHATREAVLR